MRHLGLETLSSPIGPTILVVHKDGRRRIENDEDIFQELQRRFLAEATIEYYDAGKIAAEALQVKASSQAAPFQA